MALGKFHANPGLPGARLCDDDGRGRWPPFRLVGATAKMVRHRPGGTADFYVDPPDPGDSDAGSPAQLPSTNIPRVEGWVTLSNQYRVSQLFSCVGVTLCLILMSCAKSQPTSACSSTSPKTRLRH